MGSSGDKQETILRELKTRKRLAPAITIKPHLSIDEMAQIEGINGNGLEFYIRGEIASFEMDMRVDSLSRDDEANPGYTSLIDDMYNLYVTARNAGASAPDFIRAFLTFDDFVKTFCHDATPTSRAFMKRHVDRFIQEYVHPQRLATITQSVQFYQAEGEWRLMPSFTQFNDDYFNYVECEVLYEVQKLIESGYREPSYTHCAGMAALEGISRHNAILSAQEALDLGEPILTGEFAFLKSSLNGECTTRKMGHTSVFATHGGPMRSRYCNSNWFDESDLAFGINKKRQETFMKSTNIRYCDRRQLYFDNGGEGILIGHRVPLSAVEYVYCFKRFQSAIENWSMYKCPAARVVSFEAAHTLAVYEKIIAQIAKQENVSPFGAIDLIISNKN